MNNQAYIVAALQPGLQPGGYEEELFAGEAALAAAVGLNSADDNLPYSTAELNAPEYSTDDFRMFSFKVARCSKRYVHDWRACPFAHPTENARRRDPRLHKYLPVPCPEYKRGICFRGDTCPYSHGVYECWLHPAKYRTQLCKEGPHCRRPVCFFAHSVLDLRQPTHVWDGNTFEQPQQPQAQPPPQQTAAAALMQAAAQQQAAVAAQQQAAAAAQAQVQAASRSSSDSAFSVLMQQQAAAAQAAASAAEEAMNNQGSEGSRSSGNLSASGAGPSSPHGSAHGSAHGGRAGSPAKTSSGNWSPSGAAAALDGAPVAEQSPTTPGRLLCEPPARPAGEASTVAAALASAGSGGGGVAPTADQATAAATLAAALADLQAQSRGMAPRHSIDVGALAASSSRGGLAGGGAVGGGPGSAAQSPLQPRMSFDLGQPSGSGGGAPGSAAAQLQSRMSLDSLMANRNQGGQAPWSSSLAGVPEMGATASGPRMSNAVARKLGLAPQRTANEARMAKMRSGPGMATPQRTSLDGLLQALHGSQRASLDMQQQMVNQQMLAAGLAQLNGAAVMGPNGYMPAPFPQHNGYGAPGLAGDPAAMGINPALLSMVAAQMGGAVPAPMPAHQGMPAQNAAAMAALVDSLNGWNLNGGVQPQAGGYPGAQQMPHRAASFDSGHAAMMAQQQGAPPTPFYLPAELENLMNNNPGEGPLVNPVGAGAGGGVHGGGRD